MLISLFKIEDYWNWNWNIWFFWARSAIMVNPRCAFIGIRIHRLYGQLIFIMELRWCCCGGFPGDKRRLHCHVNLPVVVDMAQYSTQWMSMELSCASLFSRSWGNLPGRCSDWPCGSIGDWTINPRMNHKMQLVA